MAQGTCKLEDCGKTGRVHLGWCLAHYTRWARTGDVGEAALRAPRTKIPAGTVCSVDTCSRKVNCGGLCKAHRSRWERHGDVQAHIPIGPAAQDKVRLPCSIDSCDLPSHSKGLCKGHDGRRRRLGDPLPNKPLGWPVRGTCAADGCEDPRYVGGYCIRHDYRVKKYGSPNGGFYEFHPVIFAGRGKPREEKFWLRVDKNGPVPAARPRLGNCWVWRLSLNSKGYGQTFLYPKIGTGTHRVAWRLLGLPLVDGLELDHLCRNTTCLRPSHLEQVTPKVNNLRSHSAAGMNFRKKHCSRGHWYTEGNTLRTNSGHRKCRACVTGESLREIAFRSLSTEDRAISKAYRRAIKNDLCFYCGAPGKQTDHFYPIVRGGGDKWDNLKRTCVACNQVKRAKCGTWFVLKYAHQPVPYPAA